MGVILFDGLCIDLFVDCGVIVEFGVGLLKKGVWVIDVSGF